LPRRRSRTALCPNGLDSERTTPSGEFLAPLDLHVNRILVSPPPARPHRILGAGPRKQRENFYTREFTFPWLTIVEFTATTPSADTGARPAWASKSPQLCFRKAVELWPNTNPHAPRSCIDSITTTSLPLSRHDVLSGLRSTTLRGDGYFFLSSV
jgi:hypothetical protein